MIAEGLPANARVLVLVPDLSLDGGVTNYYRVLDLDEVEYVDYFFVNRPGTRTIAHKVLSLVSIVPRYLSRIRHYDIVHVNPSLNPKSYWRDALLLQLARTLGKRTIVFFRGWDDVYEGIIKSSWIRSKVFRATYGNADRILVLGDIFAIKVRALLEPKIVPIQIETTVADDTGLPSRRGNQADEKNVGFTTLLFLARLVKGKGLLMTIEAMARLAEQAPSRNWRLQVAGKGPLLEEAHKLVEALGLQDLVSFEGHVTGIERAKLLQNAHLLVYPTRHGEGMPNCILEAMLFGLPVITSPAGAISEIVSDGENGALLPEPTAEQVANAVIELTKSGETYSRISERNREIAAERFTPERVRDRLLAIYREIALACQSEKRPRART